MIIILRIVWAWLMLGMTAWIMGSLFDYFLRNKLKPNPKMIFLAMASGPIPWIFVFRSLRHAWVDGRKNPKIPKDLTQCFKFLDKMLSKEDYLTAKKNPEFGIAIHHTFGRTLRNDWGLWSGSKLKDYFNGLGIYHADDMTGIIFTSYHRYLNGEHINLHEQVYYYIDYWEKEHGQGQ